jgi:hypothetical protein
VHLGQLGKSAEAGIPLGNEYVKEQTAKKRGETYYTAQLPNKTRSWPFWSAQLLTTLAKNDSLSLIAYKLDSLSLIASFENLPSKVLDSKRSTISSRFYLKFYW